MFGICGDDVRVHVTRAGIDRLHYLWPRGRQTNATGPVFAESHSSDSLPEGHMDDFGQFLFLAAGAVGLFAYLSVVHWADARTRDRQARDRLALLRRIAEQSPESAQLVVEQLRQEEAIAREHERREARKSRRKEMQAGVILVALGIGFGVMFAVVASKREPVWIVGLIPILVGVVVFAFAALDKPNETLPG
jgi:uncharacterized protein DUF6249